MGTLMYEETLMQSARVKNSIWMAGLFALVVGSHCLAQDDTAPEHPEWDMLNQYCTDCHNLEDWAGEIAFDLMTPDSLATEPAVWEKAVRKLRGRLMPPPGNDQPSQDRIDEFVSWVVDNLDNNTGIRKPVTCRSSV